MFVFCGITVFLKIYVNFQVWLKAGSNLDLQATRRRSILSITSNRLITLIKNIKTKLNQLHVSFNELVKIFFS
jgi:hypothetical protein